MRTLREKVDVELTDARVGGGFGEVSGAYRLVLFIQLEVAHKHFRLARPTESAQGGGVEPSMLTTLAVQLLLFKT